MKGKVGGGKTEALLDFQFIYVDFVQTEFTKFQIILSYFHLPPTC